MAAALHAGSKVWVADDTEAWAGAEVVKTEGESVTVRLGKETKTFQAKDVYLAEPRTAAGVEDMVKLSYLHEPGVLHNLGFRYSMNEIYTYTGNILIAVNPFQRLPHLYNEIVMNQYRASRFSALLCQLLTQAGKSLSFKTTRADAPHAALLDARGQCSANSRLTCSRSLTLRTGEPLTTALRRVPCLESSLNAVYAFNGASLATLSHFDSSHAAPCGTRASLRVFSSAASPALARPRRQSSS